MKLSNIFFFFCAALCSLCISAFSQSLGDITWQDWPTNFFTTEEVRQEWIRIHYDVYGEDISREPWAQTFVSFWNHQVLAGAEPPYGWGIAPEPLATYYDSPLPTRIAGVDFVGAWPVFIFAPNRRLVPPEWCTLQFFLQNLRQFAGTVFEPFFETMASPPSGSFFASESYPWWNARLLVTNATTTTETQVFRLPSTRLFFLAPYYPAWWALGGGRFPIAYDDARDSDLLGDSIGDNSPFAEYDGFVFFARLRQGVKLRQVIRWSSPRS